MLAIPSEYFHKPLAGLLYSSVAVPGQYFCTTAMMTLDNCAPPPKKNPQQKTKTNKTHRQWYIYRICWKKKKWYQWNSLSSLFTVSIYLFFSAYPIQAGWGAGLETTRATVQRGVGFTMDMLPDSHKANTEKQTTVHTHIHNYRQLRFTS